MVGGWLPGHLGAYPAPATRPGVTWEELQKVVRPLRDLTTAVYRSWLANGNQRTPERVRKHVRVLTEISARLEAVAAAQEARTRPA